MKITNRLREPAKVFIRHTVNKGWTLLEAPPAFERVGEAHLFEVDLKPLETRDIEIAEATPMERTLDLNADVTLEMMKVYVEAPEGGAEIKDGLKKLLGIHRQLADHTEEQPGQHDQGGWSQARYERHIEKLVREHLQEVAEALDRLVRRLRNIQVVVISSEDTRAEFEELLTHVAAAAVIGWTSAEAHATPAELLRLPERRRAASEEDRHETPAAEARVAFVELAEQRVGVRRVRDLARCDAARREIAVRALPRAPREMHVHRGIDRRRHAARDSRSAAKIDVPRKGLSRGSQAGHFGIRFRSP